MKSRTRRLKAVGYPILFLLLSGCDGWKLGWPDLSGSSGSGDAFAQEGGAFSQYWVVFNCGDVGTGVQDSVVSGEYGTLVNIYNPNDTTVGVSLRVSVSIPDSQERSNSENPTIGRFRALGVDCDDIRRLSKDQSTFISGLLVMESGADVKVIATYTAAGSIDVERILPRFQ